MSPTYSFCITTLNDAGTIRTSLNSLFSQLPQDSEVIVVDAKSRDGSTEILREYERRGLLKLIVRRCSVGLGRQIAFLNSRGRYIFSGVDTDDELKPGIVPRLIQIYHAEHEGQLLEGHDFWITPRHIAEKVGWRDTQAAEDHQFLLDTRRLGFPVAHRHDLRSRKVIRTRYYVGPFRVLENFRRFAGNRKMGLTVHPSQLITKQSTRILWAFLWYLGNSKIIDNRAVLKILDLLIMNFGVTRPGPPNLDGA